MRETINFNDHWLFMEHDITSNDSFLPIEEVKYNDATWREIQLPHDSSIEGVFKEDNPSGPRGGYAHTVLCYYRKHFTIPKEKKDSKVLLTFEGIAGKSYVYLNGTLLGSYHYSYTTVTYDLTDDLVFGEENVLAIRVDNELQPASRWYSGTGIYRDVVMTIQPKVHLLSQTVQITTPVVEKKQAVISVQYKVKNERSSSYRIVTELTIKSPLGEVVYTKKGNSFVLGAGVEELMSQTMILDDPVLWSSETPFLYHAELAMWTDGMHEDCLVLPFGIRKIEFTPDHGFLVNGHQEKLKGVCLHHDNGCLGARAYREAIYKKLKLMKEMGANAIRTTHNPESPYFLELCDQLGFYVLEEAFDEWTLGKRPRIFGETLIRVPIFSYAQYFEEFAEKDLSAMICRDRNHPSIVLWSIGNEIEELRHKRGEELTARLTHIVHTYDTTRPVTVGCNGMAAINQTKNPDMVDVCGYNYAEEFYENDHKKNPNRVIFGSEISSVTFFERRGDTVNFLGDSKKSKDDTVGRQLRAEHAIKVHDALEYVCGSFIWTGIDYLGEPTPHVWPSISSYFAPVDRALFKKDSFYFYQSIWTKQPVLHLLPYWSLNGYEHKKIPVWCFTNCEQVELLVNGKSYGIQSLDVSKSYHLEWNDVIYEPGEVKVIGTYQGQELVKTINTPKQAEKIILSMDPDQAEDNMLFYFTVKLVDSNNQLVVSQDVQVEVIVDHSLEILGVDNGDPTNHCVQGNLITTFHGLARIIVKTSTNGEHKVMVKANGGMNASLIFTTALK